MAAGATEKDACPVCGRHPAPTGQTGAGAGREGGPFPPMTSENAPCSCGAPLMRRIGQAWSLDRSSPLGRDLQRALDEGWTWDPLDEVFEKEGSLPHSLDALREAWGWVDPGDELRD